MRKIFYLFLLVGLLVSGCAKYATNQRLSTSLSATTQQLNAYRTESSETSLAIYQCVLTQEYSLEAERMCEQSEGHFSHMCAISDTWESYCMNTEETSNGEVLTNPRIGVILALRNVISNIRENYLRNTQIEGRETIVNVENDFVRTPE